MVQGKRLTLWMLAALLLSAPAQATDSPEAKAVVERMIHKLRGHVNVSEYAMTVTRPTWARTIKMKVWDDRTNSRAFVKISEPAKEAGTSFLRLGYNLWNYLPSVEKVMKIPPSMMLQAWMGSDFTNDDLIKESSYIDDYTHEIAGKEAMDGESVLKIELIPKPNAPVVWGKVIYWVREKDDLPVRQNFIDEKGRLVKDLHFMDIRKMDGVMLPTRWEMTPVLKEGNKTVLDLSRIDFDPSPPVPESVFSEKNLRP